MRIVFFLIYCLFLGHSKGLGQATSSEGLTFAGINVTPHQVSSEMQWRRPAEPTLSARTEIFLSNPSQETKR
ncbi:MAG: hypothetical protein LW724_15450, partial [Planctomycetaceae bacterium]|nr:hypothetical protein [Planctomycetaceae bacterium]